MLKHCVCHPIQESAQDQQISPSYTEPVLHSATTAQINQQGIQLTAAGVNQQATQPAITAVVSQQVIQPTTTAVVNVSQGVIQSAVSEQAIADKLTKLQSAIPSGTTMFRQPHILQSAIQLTAAVVNQLSLIQPTNRLSATINQPVVPPPFILPNQSTLQSAATKLQFITQPTPVTVRQSATTHPAAQLIVPLSHQAPRQHSVNQTAMVQSYIPTMPTVADRSGMLHPATHLITTVVSQQAYQPTTVSKLTMANHTTTTVVNQPTVVQSVAPVNALTLQNAVNKGSTRYPDLSFTKTICGKGEALDITQRFLYQLPGAVYMSVARILFIPSELHFTYDIQVLFVSIKSGTVNNIREFFEVCDIIAKKSDYKFCPGLDKKMYFDEYHAVIRYHIKGVRLWDKPFDRIDSDSCLLWHQLAKNISKEEKLKFAVLCKQCKRLLALLAYQKRRSDVSPARWTARQQHSS